jgi:3-oxoacyl-ACP reductase-like protein
METSMSIFGNILNKIFHHGQAQAAPAAKPAASAQPAATPQPAPAAPAAPQAAPAASSAPAQPVDVEAVLSDLAQQHGGGGNWRTSIVDLLKLLDLDSSLSARKELAQELGVHVGNDGSAEENIALHNAVMRKLEENGGKVPADLKG